MFECVSRNIYCIVAVLIWGSTIDGGEPVRKATEDRAESVCPLYFYGQWNGVYNYYGEFKNASGTCTPTGASANQAHQIGNSCTDCLDGIGFIPSGFIPPNLAKIHDYVGPRQADANPGQSEDSKSTFIKGGFHVTCLDDWVVKVENSGFNYYFRIIKIHFSSGHPNGQIERDELFAQELDPLEMYPNPEVAAVLSVLDRRTIKLRITHGQQNFDVIAFGLGPFR